MHLDRHVQQRNVIGVAPASRYSHIGVGGEISPVAAAAWAEHFAAASYGDALLGSTLSLLLRPDAAPAVQARCGSPEHPSTHMPVTSFTLSP